MAGSKKSIARKSRRNSHAAKESRGEVDKNFIGLTSKVFNVLEVLGASRQGTLTLEEVTREVKLAKTTVHRLLYSLARIGYVEKDEPTGRYGLSTQFFELGRNALPHQYLSSLARPLMKNLVDRFGVSMNLGVLDEDRIVYVAVVESPHPFRCAATVGESCCCHCTSMGKSLLAYLPARDRDRILASQGLPRMTDRTIASKEALLAELARVRESGVAMDRGENIEGVVCVGAPILDQEGRPIAGISASAPAGLMETHLDMIEAEVRRISVQLSKMLGYA
jgi:IclR family acetate operon transcriptional repressor